MTPCVCQSKIATVRIGGSVSLAWFLLGFVDYFFLDEPYTALFLLKQELNCESKTKAAEYHKRPDRDSRDPKTNLTRITKEFIDRRVNKNGNFHLCGRHPKAPQALEGRLLTTPIVQDGQESCRGTAAAPQCWARARRTQEVSPLRLLQRAK